MSGELRRMDINMVRWSLLFLLWFVVALNVAAQQNGSASGPQITPVTTVVTVSANAIPMNAAPATVNVITRDFIENAHAEDFADLVRNIPDLYLSQTGGRGGLTTLTIRGGKPNFTLVLIDGIPINDIGNILGGSYDFSLLSPDNIDRIEIVSGPLSSLFGSEAISGVVNIISRRAETRRYFDVGGEAGNVGTGQGHFSIGGTVGSSPYSLSGSYLTMGPEVGGGHYSLGTVALGSSHSFGGSKILQLLIRFHTKESSGFPANGGGPEYSILRQLQTDHSQELISGLSFKQQVNSYWSYSVDGDMYLRIEDGFTPAILDATPPTANSVPSELTHETFIRARIGVSNSFTINRHVSADLRVGFKNERGTSDSVISATIPDNYGLNRPTLSVNGGLLFQLGRLTATGDLGLEKASGFVDVAPRIGASYRVGSGETRLKASWGTGFNLPSFEALGDPIVGNPQLKPEYSNGLDAGIDETLKPANLHWALTYYWNSFRNLVDFSPQQFRLVNRNLARTQGFEWNASISPMHQLSLNGQLTFLDAHLLDTVEHLRDLPRWRGGVGIEWKFTSRVRLRTDALWVGQRYDFQVPIPNQQTVPKYATTDLVVSYMATDRSKIYLRIDNLLNSKYQEFLGFPNGGIYARIGIDFQLVKP
jgi:vitamin B12 transporter